MIAKRLNAPTAEAEQAIKEVLKGKIKTNPDGFFFVNSKSAIRTMEDKEALKTLDEMAINNFICHFRIATEGKANVNNVHGWTKDGWTFVHNGSFGGYTETGENGKHIYKGEYEYSDSRRFFMDLMKKLKGIKSEKDKPVRQAIQATVYLTSYFNGRCALYHAPTDRLFLFGDWQVYTIENSHFILSSASIYFTPEKKNKSFKGIELEYSGGAGLMGKGEVDGIGVIKNFTSKDNWHYRRLADLNKPTYSTKPIGYVTSDDAGYWKDWRSGNVRHWDTKTKAWVTDDESKGKKIVKVNHYNTANTTEQVNSILPKIIVPENKPVQVKDTEAYKQWQDYYEERLKVIIGKDENDFELYVDDGTLGAKEGVHDIYNNCCEQIPPECRPITSLETLFEDSKVYGDGTELLRLSEKRLF